MDFLFSFPLNSVNPLLNMPYLCFHFLNMYHIKINEQSDALAVSVTNAAISVNNKERDWDMVRLADGSFSILLDGKSYIALVEETDKASKQMTLRINGHKYQVSIEEPIDQLLKKMGLNNSATKKAEVIKAPMPGLVLKIMVAEGQEVKKGDPVLILEAMKMENVFKAPADATVKSIKAEAGKAVEKGQVLIELA